MPPNGYLPDDDFFTIYTIRALPLANERSTSIVKARRINEVNQLAKGQAHDAMVDVEATIALAKYFKQSHKVWDYLCGYYDKATEQQRCKACPITMESQQVEHHEGLMIFGKVSTQTCLPKRQ